MTTRPRLRSLIVSASALLIAMQVMAAEPQTETSATKFYDSISGEWIVKWCEHRDRKVPSSVVSLVVNPETITMFEANGGTKKLRHQLFHGTDGWVIDLYATYGEAKGRLYPSRIAIEHGKLKLMMPLKADAIRRRPDSLESKANPEWVTMHLIRSDAEAKREATDESSDARETSAHSILNSSITPRSP